MSGWRAGRHGDVFDGDDLIASIHGDGLTRKRNGRIMAAGEEMLDALEGMVSSFRHAQGDESHHTRKAFLAAVAAIAKANGEAAAGG